MTYFFLRTLNFLFFAVGEKPWGFFFCPYFTPFDQQREWQGSNLIVHGHLSSFGVLFLGFWLLVVGCGPKILNKKTLDIDNLQALTCAQLTLCSLECEPAFAQHIRIFTRCPLSTPPGYQINCCGII